MTPCVEGLLEIAHVGILLGIDARIWEEHGEVAAEKVGVSQMATEAAGQRRYSMKNFIVTRPEPLDPGEQQKKKRKEGKSARNGNATFPFWDSNDTTPRDFLIGCPTQVCRL